MAQKASILFNCQNPECREPLETRAELAGRKVYCSRCGHISDVPAHSLEPAVFPSDVPAAPPTERPQTYPTPSE